MARRLIFGPVLIAMILAIVALDDWLGGAALPAPLAFLGMGTGHYLSGTLLLCLGVLAAARGGFELARMFQAVGINASRRGLAWSAAAGVLVGGLTIGRTAEELWESAWPGGAPAGTILATTAAIVVFWSMAAYIRHKDLKGVAGAVAAAVFAFIYCGVVLGFLLALARSWSVWAVVAVIFTVKACDSGAYFTGTFTPADKRRRLIPWISPGKTWQGLVGGLLTAAAFGAFFVWLDAVVHAPAPPLVPIGYADGVVLGLLLGLVGQAGDLSASVLKRDAAVKDAGRILPGFGGVIDMLDSLLIAAPVAYWFLLIRAPGH